MSNPSTVTNTAASSGFKALIGSAKGIALIATAMMVVAGGAGLGIWRYVSDQPQLQVVERSVSYIFPSGAGEQTLKASCLSNETLLSGGYAFPDGFVMESDEAGLEQAWQVKGVTEDGATTLTAYALCINAKLPSTRGGYETTYAYHDRADKLPRVNPDPDSNYLDMTLNGPFDAAPRWGSPGSMAHAHCPNGYATTATGFYLDTFSKEWGGAPVPLFANAPGSDSWTTALNNGAHLSGQWFTLGEDDRDPVNGLQSSKPLVRKTLINRLHQNSHAFNELAQVRPVCVGGLRDVALVEKTIAVVKGSSALDRVTCPKDTLLLGGGFIFTNNVTIENKDNGTNAIPFSDDGWLSAERSAPALDQPSGRPVRSWYVDGVNGQTHTYYANSVVIYDKAEGMFSDVAVGPGVDINFIVGFSIPAQQPLKLSALCGRSDATPTAPAFVPLSTLAASTATPTSAPQTPTATPQPTATPPVASPTPTPQPAAKPPSVSIQQPTSGATLKRGCDQQFQGTALTVPGNQPITNSQVTQWTLRNTQTSTTYPLGNGPGGQFTIPLAPDGQSYAVEFKVTDIANGLSATATVPVSVSSCIA